jgi:hypothetical protein
MATPTRFALEPGRFYHWIHRSVPEVNLFEQSRDYESFTDMVHERLKRWCQPAAHCLIPNHFHFLLKLGDADTINIACEAATGAHLSTRGLDTFVSNQLGHVLSTWGKDVNGRLQRRGHVFDGRYRLSEVDSNAGLRNVVCYIHRNPIHHGLVREFEDWPHSSFQQIKDRWSDWPLRWLFSSVSEFVDVHNSSKQEFQEQRYWKAFE